jgi:multiple sugar transport system permease protein
MTDTTRKGRARHVLRLTARPRKSMIWRRWAGRTTLYAVLVVAAVLFSVPVFWLVLSSFKTNVQYNAYPVQVFPKEWRWQNYYAAVTCGESLDSPREDKVAGTKQYLGALQRSLLLIVISTVPGVLTSAMVGFGFARHRAPGRGLLFKVMIAMLMVPGVTTTIPQYVLYSYLHLVGTYWPWLFGAFGTNVFFTFMFRQFFASFPKELEDAAEIDGCSRWGTFWRIFMPNAGPVIVAAKAMELLLQMIDDQLVLDPVPRFLMEPELIVRDSCGPPPSGP